MPDPLAPSSDGHTELGEDERTGLIPSYVATLAELHEAEQRNITLAVLRRTPSVDLLLDDSYLRDLHNAMFGDVWSWAGQYRVRDTNIGLAFEGIPGAVRSLVLDARTWVSSETYAPDELAIRFHHRLVAIHPFPNGNGRHGRIATDFLIMGLGAPRFTWGSESALDTDDLRAAYVDALRRADAGDTDDLRAFARS